MPKLIDLTGQKFGRLTVIERAPNKYTSGGNSKVMWKCFCDCDINKTNPVFVDSCSLRNKHTVSCGCRLKELNDSAGIRFSEINSKENKYVFDNDICYLYDSKNNEFIIDKDDYALVKKYCWHLHHTGYVQAKYKNVDNNRHIMLHKLVMNDLDNNYFIDHINGNKQDCRKSNLRIVTREQNNSNKCLQKNNTSGIPGVYWHNDKWEVYIGHNKKRIYLGSSENIDEARNIRIKGEQEYHKEFSFLNSRNVTNYF